MTTSIDCPHCARLMREIRNVLLDKRAAVEEVIALRGKILRQRAALQAACASNRRLRAEVCGAPTVEHPDRLPLP